MFTIERFSPILLRFGLVSILNAVLGFVLIFLAIYSGLDLFISNVIGYAVGSLFSFYLKKEFVFKGCKCKPKVTSYFLLVILAYLTNLLVVFLLFGLLGPYISTIIGGVVYFIFMFIASSRVVFR